MRTPRLHLSAAAAVAAALLAAAPARAQETPSTTPFAATTLSVSAEGEVSARPDLAILTIGASSQATTAAAAAAAMRTRIAATIAAIKGSGVADKDVQTSSLNLNARYDEGPDRPRRLSGYEASEQVTVTVRDIARTGEVLDAALAQGANTVDGVGFDLADRTPVENAARRSAVKALGDKARLYAEATGLRVKRLVSLSEGGGGPQPLFRMAAPMAMAMSRARTPVEPGELRVRESVSAVYELER